MSEENVELARRTFEAFNVAKVEAFNHNGVGSHQERPLDLADEQKHTRSPARPPVRPIPRGRPR